MHLIYVIKLLVQGIFCNTSNGCWSNQYINMHTCMLHSPNEEEITLCRCQWVSLVKLPLRILWEHYKAHTHTHTHPHTQTFPHPNIHTRKQVTHANRSHRPHTDTFMCVQRPTQLLSLCRRCSGWVIPKWTFCLTASDKLSAQFISITTKSLASPACMIDSTLTPLSYCHTFKGRTRWGRPALCPHRRMGYRL